jgi:hypothetical protein
MSQQAAFGPPSSRFVPAPAGSLRAELEARRAEGRRFSLREAIGLVVPLCTTLASAHASGERLFVHGSSLRFAGGVLELDAAAARVPAAHPRDIACLPPEEKRGEPGDARGSVYSVGALFYELVTGAAVGPGMRRPSDLVPDLPGTVELILAKALVADPGHRPADLGALAQAFHHISPGASIAPPPADESHLDHDTDFDVDVSTSMLPPPPSGVAAIGSLAAPRMPQGFIAFSPNALPALDRSPGPSQDPTLRLAEMKAALEADPRPRYVVIKDGMDHGPFSAVELLQQIASAQFTGSHLLRDSFSAEEHPIREWEEFAPFAQQARLNREIAHERTAVEVATAAEKKGTATKTAVAVGVVALLAGVGIAVWLTIRQSNDRELVVQADEAVAVDVDGGLGAGKKGPAVGGKGGGQRVTSSDGKVIPTLGSKGSCESAIAAYVEEYKIGNDGVPPDLGAADYGAVLNRGSYMTGCGVPSNMEVNICAAVQNGRAVGVTVNTSPSSPGVASCISGAVRGLSFPSHPRLDVARTTFAAQ